ncbi:MAG: hypothetical protein LBJ74_00410, partial [Heliobacteriaceae bacterium]|nr:hypothetical protein [Heliobacteriaceae bacterium]
MKEIIKRFFGTLCFRMAILIILILIVLYGLYYRGIPAVVNLPGRAAQIEELALKQTGFKISLKNPQLTMGLMPAAKIKADEFAILNDDDTKALSAAKPELKISLLPLLFKKINIKYLYADDIEANFTFKDSKLKLGQYEFNSEDKPPAAPKRTRIKHGLITLNDIRIEANSLNAESTDNIEFKELKICPLTPTLSRGEREQSSRQTLNLTASGKVTRLNTKTPHYDLKVTLNPSRIENILPLVPADSEKYMQNVNMRKLKQTGLWGDISANLEIKGKGAKHPHVYGNVLAQNLYLIQPFPGSTPKATVKMTFLGDHFDFDSKVPVSISQSVNVKGSAELNDTTKTDLHINSTDSVDLKSALTVLNPLHDILKFNLGPLPLMELSGKGSIDLRVGGTKQNPHAWGTFAFKDATASFIDIKNMTLKNADGTLIFNDRNTTFLAKNATLNSKPISISGTCTLLGVLDFDIKAYGQDLKDLLKVIQTSALLKELDTAIEPLKAAYGPANVTAKLTGRVKSGEIAVYNKNLFAKGTVELLSDTVVLKDSPVIVKKINGKVNFNNYDGNYKLTASAANIPVTAEGNWKNQSMTGELNVRGFDLSALGDSMPDIRDPKGKININAKIKNNVVNATSALENISFFYVPQHVRVGLVSGNVFVRNNTMVINKLNAHFGQMPVLLDGKIFNILEKNPRLDLYVNAKPGQEFLDQFVNNKTLYPVKIKGDVNLTSKISGTQNNVNSKTELKVDEDSQIYYMGATIGDPQYPVRITLDSNYTPGRVRINALQYDKIISSQNQKPYSIGQLHASGAIDLLSKNNAGFRNLKIVTQAPTDAKIFNIIFRKPLMKQGVFSSDLVLNGTALDPKVRGTLDITSIDMPFFESTIKDINLDFKQDYIHATSKGTVFSNDIKFYTIMKNKLTPPYVVESVKLELADLDINHITASLRDYEAENLKKHSNPPLVKGGMPQAGGISSAQSFDLSQLIINRAEITAGKVKVRNINASDCSALLNLNEKMVLDISKFKFNIADGVVNGDFK